MNDEWWKTVSKETGGRQTKIIYSYFAHGFLVSKKAHVRCGVFRGKWRGGRRVGGRRVARAPSTPTFVASFRATRVFASSRLFAFFGLPSASFFRCRSASTHISISGEAQISPGEAPSQEVSASSASDSAPP
jgi:hypothetical protein|tara:strand:- start:1155 stop:1550 length:396 start_codon:yes stop_codon:yes gene_type:complete